ncbi:MAG TPA: hypothetical protein VH643_05585 [Gemmataceae bacterium]|jgi:hypothetical protein
MDKANSAQRDKQNAIGRPVEANAAEHGRPSPMSSECFRILATVARTGEWSPQDAQHRDSCPFCQKTDEHLRQSQAKRRPLLPASRVRNYASLDASARRRIDVAVVQAVLDLNSPKRIVRRLLREHRVRVAREQIPEIVQRTRRNSELVFKTEGDLELGSRLQARSGLESVRVVRCTGVEPIIRWAAESLRDIIVELSDDRPSVGRPRILVGVAGGPMSFNVMSACGHLLEQEGFDGEVVVDAMLPGAFWLHMGFVRPDWPRFQFQNLWEQTHHLRETNYGGHYIPPMVSRAEFGRLLVNEQAIQDTVRSVIDLDVILTSGAIWDDPHGASELKRNFADPEQLRREHDIVGELLWHPLSERTPVRLDLVPVTSLGPDGLERLPELIQRGKRVVAVLGPCVACKTLKTPLVKCLLRQDKPLITDLVIDALSAEKVVAERPPGKDTRDVI